MSWRKRNLLTRSNLRDLVVLLSLTSTVAFGVTTGEIIAGFLLLAVGCFMHFLSKGVLIRNTVLTRRGIYEIVRHPYYLSNFLIDYSFCVLSGNLYLLVAYPFLFFWSYGPTMEKEEAHLQSIHGDAFIRYRSRIPQVFPDDIPFQEWSALFEGFSRKRISWKECGRILRFWSLGFFIILFHQLASDGLSVLKDESLLVSLTVILFTVSAVAIWISNRKSRISPSHD